MNWRRGSGIGRRCVTESGMRCRKKNNASLAQFTDSKLHPTEDDDANYLCGSSEMSKRQTRKFCSTSAQFLYEDTQLIGIRGRDNTLINPMKTLLIASLFSVTLALTSFGQPPPPTAPATSRPPGPPPTTAISPATAPVTAPAMSPATAPVTATSPAIPGTTPAVPGTTPAVPGTTATVPGMSPATAISPATTTTTTSASPSGTPTPSATPESEFDKNFFIHNFKAGGPI